MINVSLRISVLYFIASPMLAYQEGIDQKEHRLVQGDLRELGTDK